MDTDSLQTRDKKQKRRHDAAPSSARRSRVVIQGFRENEIHGTAELPQTEETDLSKMPDMTLKYKANELLAKIEGTLQDALDAFARDTEVLGKKNSSDDRPKTSSQAPPSPAYGAYTLNLANSLEKMRASTHAFDSVQGRKPATARPHESMRAKAESLGKRGNNVKIHPAFVSMLRSNASTQTEDAEFMQFKVMSQELDETKKALSEAQRELATARHSLRYHFQDMMEKCLRDLRSKTESDIEFFVDLHTKDVKKVQSAMGTELRHEVARQSATITEDYREKEKSLRDAHAKAEAALQSDVKHLQRALQERDDRIRHLEQDIFHKDAQLACAQMDIDSYAKEAAGIRSREEEIDKMKTQVALMKNLLDMESSKVKEQSEKFEAAAAEAESVKRQLKTQTEGFNAAKRKLEVELEALSKQKGLSEQQLGQKIKSLEDEVANLRAETKRQWDISSIVASRQNEALETLMKERDELVAEVKQLESAGAHSGRWEQGVDGRKVWVEDKSELDGVHSAVDALGMSRSWRWYSGMQTANVQHPPKTAITPRPPQTGKRSVAQRRLSVRNMAERLSVTPRPDAVAVQQTQSRYPSGLATSVMVLQTE